MIKNVQIDEALNTLYLSVLLRIKIMPQPKIGVKFGRSATLYSWKVYIFTADLSIRFKTRQSRKFDKIWSF